MAPSSQSMEANIFHSMTSQAILSKLPYSYPFLFVDELTEINENGITGNYTFDPKKPVLPNEKVIVKSEKIYFRFNKLKCKVQMFNMDEELVCRGEISGMILNNT